MGETTRSRLAMRWVVCLVAIVVTIPTVALAATYRVRADGKDWVPKTRRIVKGDSINWRNPTGRRHDVRAYGGNWTYRVILDPGEKATRKFGTRGVFKYRCTYHSGIVDGKCAGMCGVVRVRASA